MYYALFFLTALTICYGEKASVKAGAEEATFGANDQTIKKESRKQGNLLTLTEALTESYDHQQNQAARESVRSQHERIAQAKAEFLPTLSLEGSYQNDDTKNSGDLNLNATNKKTRTHSGAVVLKQNILTGGGSVFRYREADAQVRKTWMDTLYKTEQTVFRDAANSFFDVFSAIKGIMVAKGNLEFLKKQFESTTEKHNVGDETITNVKATEAEYYKGQADYEASIANLESQKADFLYKTNLQVSDNLKEPFLDDLLPKSLDIAIDMALNDHYQLKSALCDIDVAQARTGTARSGLLPKIDLQARGSKQKQDMWGQLNGQQPGVLYTNDVQVTLSASVPIYEGGAVRSQLRQSHKDKAAARISYENLRRQIQSTVKSAWINLKSLEQQAKALEKVVAASKLAVNGLMEEQKAGTKTILDVLEEQRRYFNYQKQLIDAENAYLKGCITLLFTMGVLDVAHLKLKIATFDPSKDYEQIKGRF